jgi:hypothetical protein
MELGTGMKDRYKNVAFSKDAIDELVGEGIRRVASECSRGDRLDVDTERRVVANAERIDRKENPRRCGDLTDAGRRGRPAAVGRTLLRRVARTVPRAHCFHQRPVGVVLAILAAMVGRKTF